MKTPWYTLILVPLAILLLNACTSLAPPTEFAPDGETVRKAILLQLKQTEASLSEYLLASKPKLEIDSINVKKIDPMFISNLAAYHLQGTYDLTLKLPRQKAMQPSNSFDIYLQRQAEGKTWRLLRRDLHPNDAQSYWTSYSIEP